MIIRVRPIQTRDEQFECDLYSALGPIYTLRYKPTPAVSESALWEHQQRDWLRLVATSGAPEQPFGLVLFYGYDGRSRSASCQAAFVVDTTVEDVIRAVDCAIAHVGKRHPLRRVYYEATAEAAAARPTGAVEQLRLAEHIYFDGQYRDLIVYRVDYEQINR